MHYQIIQASPGFVYRCDNGVAHGHRTMNRREARRGFAPGRWRALVHGRFGFIADRKSRRGRRAWKGAIDDGRCGNRHWDHSGDGPPLASQAGMNPGLALSMVARVVEMKGFEPSTSALRTLRSPN